jgi:hypothetical protein
MRSGSCGEDDENTTSMAREIGKLDLALWRGEPAAAAVVDTASHAHCLSVLGSAHVEFHAIPVQIAIRNLPNTVGVGTSPSYSMAWEVCKFVGRDIE